MMDPYYADERVEIHHGDAAEILPRLDLDRFAAMVTDPPYGIAYRSNMSKLDRIAREIDNDHDTTTRDRILALWGDRPSIVFGSIKAPPPPHRSQPLVWHKIGAGMGDLAFPWRPDWELIYVNGDGFHGHRGSSVLSFPLRRYRGDTDHPHEKPVDLLRVLIAKCPPGPILDPFAGSGTTLRAALDLGRQAVGIELADRYLDVIVSRCAQDTLDLTV